MRHNILRVVSVLMAALLAIHSSAAVATAEKTQAELQAPYEAAMEENLKVPLEVWRVAVIINDDAFDQSEFDKNFAYFSERMESCWRIRVKIVQTFVLDEKKTNFRAEKVFAPYTKDEGMVEWKKLLETADQQGKKVNIPQLVNDWVIDGLLVWDRGLTGLEAAELGPSKYYSYADFEGDHFSERIFFSPRVSRDLPVLQLVNPGGPYMV